MASLDPLSQPLHAVTFCVVDLETTGGSPASSTITEVGAATYRGGERLGTFQTLVNPCAPMPPEITALTGITPAMLSPAPTISRVLPSLAEFVGGAVLVGHNLRFDTSFLDAALAATGRSVLDHLRVDTVPLARRLLGDDVPDCTLSTLATHLGLGHRPTHRALDDALATAELLHLLLERAAAFGVTLLDDLLSLPGIAGHPHVGKLRLTTGLPRAPGVFVVRNRPGEAVHVGWGDDVRRRVRSYFSATPAVGPGQRRLVGPVLREAHTFEHLACASGLDAAVAATRLSHALAPSHGLAAASDRAATSGWAVATGPGQGRYVSLTAGTSPRLAVGRLPRRGARAQLGPVPKAEARPLVEAIEAAADAVVSAAVAADAPLAAAPTVTEPTSEARVDAIVRGLGGQGSMLVGTLLDQAADLEAAGRPAAAVRTRQQAGVLADALERQWRVDMLRRAGRVALGLPGGARAELVRGRLVRTWHADRTSVVWASDDVRHGPPRPEPARVGDVRLDAVDLPPAAGPLPPETADELVVIAGWLDGHAGDVRLLHVEGELVSSLPRLPQPPGEAGDEADDEPTDDAGVDLADAVIDMLVPVPRGDIAEMAEAQPLRCAAC